MRRWNENNRSHVIDSFGSRCIWVLKSFSLPGNFRERTVTGVIMQFRCALTYAYIFKILVYYFHLQFLPCWISLLIFYFAIHQDILLLKGRAHLHDTTVVYDCSFWFIRFSRKSLQNQVQHSRANSEKELCLNDVIAYAKVKNRVRQSYRADKPEEVLPRKSLV